jgi:hypothetical protein
MGTYENWRQKKLASKKTKAGQIELGYSNFGTYTVTDLDTGQDMLVQTDLDFPGTASTFGWSPAMVQKDFTKEIEKKAFDEDWTAEQENKALADAQANFTPCRHPYTDGTTDCKVCGVTVGEFIESARQYLDDHIGDVVEDPGYFGGE